MKINMDCTDWTHKWSSIKFYVTYTSYTYLYSLFFKFYIINKLNDSQK